MDKSKELSDGYHAEIQSEDIVVAQQDEGWEDPRVKKIKRKVDIRLSAMLALMYIVNQIDRNNLPNACVNTVRFAARPAKRFPVSLPEWTTISTSLATDTRS